MSTVIRDSGDLTRTLNIYGNNTNALNKHTLKLSSGLKINSAGDDPSGFAMTQRMRQQLSAIDQSNVNAQNDTSLVKVAEAAIATTVDVIQTLKARAMSAASDHYNDDDRAIVQIETEQYLQTIDNTAQAATFNNIHLLDGSKAQEGLNFHIGGEANFSVNLKINDMTSKGIGLEGLDLSTRTGAESALGVLDTALDNALKEITKLGTMEERLGFARDTLNSMSENTQAAISSITDSDTAKEMTGYVKANILSQSAQQGLIYLYQNAFKVLDLIAPLQ